MLFKVRMSSLVVNSASEGAMISTPPPSALMRAMTLRQCVTRVASALDFRSASSSSASSARFLASISAFCAMVFAVVSAS
jgi:hypothetical protein